MARPIKDFISEVKNAGLSKNNRFSVEFNLPKSVQARSLEAQSLRSILLFCDSTQLPGLNISTTPARTFGEIREMPYEKLFEPITLSFYVDTNMNVKMLFDSWLNSIQSPGTRTYNYYKNYITEMRIAVQDIQDQKTYEVTLHEAYPKSISAISLDMASRDVMKMSVSMVYKYYTTTQFTRSESPNQFQRPPFSINGKVPSSYLNDFSSFQGKYNDFNNVVQNGAIQVPQVGADTGAGISQLIFT